MSHKAKAIKGNFAGSWLAVCSCGWRGPVRGFKGARAKAVDDYHEHLYEVGAER
ncbi:hypothetical protein [Gulosibacter molinativorax]|uniref:hypothetical protein n=1 Tax=Gulosibacter molinativorax TaxID=256821 RepID=UPI00146EE274|nr:hypothetical protein [Gulosibacter molinativorax]QUY63365.1 Hypotetical protein [Gulosibacter molinativorax]